MWTRSTGCYGCRRHLRRKAWDENTLLASTTGERLQKALAAATIEAEDTQGMVDYAFQHLRLERVVATTTYDNAAIHGRPAQVRQALEETRIPSRLGCKSLASLKTAPPLRKKEAVGPNNQNKATARLWLTPRSPGPASAILRQGWAWRQGERQVLTSRPGQTSYEDSCSQERNDPVSEILLALGGLAQVITGRLRISARGETVAFDNT
jgi:hypothetical protein